MEPILLVTHSLSRTGASKVAVGAANELSRFYKIFLLNMNPLLQDIAGDVSEAVDILPPLGRLDSLSQRLLNGTARRVGIPISRKHFVFRNYLRTLHPKLVLFNTMYHSDLQIITKREGIPSLRWLHEAGLQSHLTTREVKELNMATRILGCSESALKAGKNRGVRVHPQPVRPALDTPLGPVDNTCQQKSSVAPSAAVVGSDGKRKGVDYAIKVAERAGEFKIHWYGQLQSPPPGIDFHGLVKSVPYELHTDFLLLSTDEPYGLVALEALACGSRIAGWRHLNVIQDLESVGLAVGFEEGDIDGMVNHLLTSEWVPRWSAKATFLADFEPGKIYGKQLWRHISSLGWSPT